MTFIVERLAELRRHLDHLRELRPRVAGHAYVKLDLDRVVEALDDVAPVEEFLRVVASIATGSER